MRIDEDYIVGVQGERGLGLESAHRCVRRFQRVRRSVGGAVRALGQGTDRRIQVLRQPPQ